MVAKNGFASFEYGARLAFFVKECGCLRRNRPQTAYKSLCAHAEFILTQMRARGEAAFRTLCVIRVFPGRIETLIYPDGTLAVAMLSAFGPMLADTPLFFAEGKSRLGYQNYGSFCA